MNEEKNNSRVNKYDKRRKTTKSITVLIGIAIGLVILLIGIWIFGGKDKNKAEPVNDQDKNEEVTEDQDNGDSSDAEDSKDNDKETSADEEDKNDESENDEYVENEQIPTEDIDDSNVLEAYTANWQPVGTTQEEPHTTTFDEGSDDWKEMMKAIAYALKIEEDEFVNHWIGNGGEQRVDGHVQSLISDEHYTVYLEWQESDGWIPIKVERVERFIHPKQAN